MTVSALRKAIMEKEKYLLPGVAAKCFEIWKVSIAVEGLAKMANIKLKDGSRDGVEKLGPRMTLGRTFPDPPVDGFLHIVVRPPDSVNISPRQGHFPVLHFLDGSRTVYQVEGPSDTGCLPSNVGFTRLLDTPGIIATDKTQFIEVINKRRTYQYMFLRLPRWGKSTFLQMLANYYDKSKADEFMDMFGQLYIGRNPTPCRNSLLVMIFDFSQIHTLVYADMKIQFHDVINEALQVFLEKNARFLGNPDPRTLIQANSTLSLKRILNLVESMGEKLFVGIDDYDSPASMCLFENPQQQSHYTQTAQWFKTQFFAIMKLACYTVVEKYWLTGVFPVFRDGFSPLSVTSIISRKSHFNSCCGLTEDEVKTVATDYLASTHSDDALATVLQEMKLWYGGYRFCEPGHAPPSSPLYNPQSVFAHLDAVKERSKPDHEQNITHSDSVLKAISHRGGVTVNDFPPLHSGELRTKIATNFGAADVHQVDQREDITWGLLYHYRFITQGDKDGVFVIPNRSMRALNT